MSCFFCLFFLNVSIEVTPNTDKQKNIAKEDESSQIKCGSFMKINRMKVSCAGSFFVSFTNTDLKLKHVG